MRSFEQEPKKINLKFYNEFSLMKKYNMIVTPTYKLKVDNPTLNPIGLLEELSTEENIDRFIRRIFAPYAAQQPRPDITWQPIALPPSAREEFTSSYGLVVSVQSNNPRLTISGDEVIFGEGEHTRIDFTPDGRTFRDAKKITESLMAGINGIAELVDAIEGGKVAVAPVFVGRTNIHMAVIAQRLGFTVVDECKTESGEVNQDLAVFTVVGKLGEIRRRVNEFKQSQAYERLQKRDIRLRVASQAILDAVFPSVRNVGPFPQLLNR